LKFVLAHSCCGLVEDKPYELQEEQKTLADPCPQCQFNFPVMPATPSHFAVFKDIPKCEAIPEIPQAEHLSGE
jgi:hypothetical protein